MLAGVDGCKGGWIAAIDDGQDVRMQRFDAFAELLRLSPALSIIAVDMPIGLPEQIVGPGRAPETQVRPLLGARQSSVFSIPCRAAVYADAGPYADLEAAYAAHRRACEVARLHSTPPRGTAIQSFMIFPKIREIDTLLRADPALCTRVFEVHPEVAFWRMNGERPVATPKKVKGRPFEPGLAERKVLLTRQGLPQGVVHAVPLKGVGADDHLDALAGLVVARRIRDGLATPFPNPPERDAHGLPIAIWA